MSEIANERVGQRRREGEGEGGKELQKKRGWRLKENTPMLIGDGTSVLMYVFLVCASPPLLFSGPLAVPDLCHHLLEKHFLLLRGARAGNGAEPELAFQTH